jgi:hypothetical protein
MRMWRILMLVALVTCLAQVHPLHAQLECQVCYAWQQQENEHIFESQAQCCFVDDGSCSSITSEHPDATPQTSGQGCEIEPVAGGYQCVAQPPCDDGSGDGGGGGGGGGTNCTVHAGAGCPAECASCQHLLF